MRANGRRWLLPQLAVLLALLPACAAKRYDASAIDGVPEHAGRGDGQRAYLRLPGIRLSVEPDDAVAALTAEQAATAVAAGASHLRPLTVRLRLETKELGYSFDPTRVTLRRGGQEWHARPTTPLRADCVSAGPASPAGGARYWLATRSCFAVAFDVAVTDEAGQELVLDGLARGSRPLAPLTLSIARRQGVARSLTPGAKKAGTTALETALYILMLPFAAAGAY